MSVSQLDIDIVLKDINDIRARPETMVEKFMTVLYSFKNFGKQTDQLSLFIEEFIRKLPKMRKLPELEICHELDQVALALLEEYSENDINLANLSVSEMEKFTRPFIKNYSKISVICEEQKTSSLFINKVILKKDEDCNSYGEKNRAYSKIFDGQMNLCGIAARKLNRLPFYVIVLVDDYEPVKKFDTDVVSDDELNEYKILFDLFDEDKDGLLIPKDFNDKLKSVGISRKIPSILKFGEYFNDPKYKRGVDFNSFVEAIIEFGNLEEDDAIRRIFELYVDDIDQYTITLDGMKRIVKELNSSVLQDQILQLFKFALNKEVDLTFQEFKDYILRAKKEGKIKLTKKEL
jgi:Ca2+-binding EF-hand superfamily protein